MDKEKIATGVAHDLPLDVHQALVADKQALAAWEDLTPLARNEWICWTISVKKPETRELHIERLLADLQKGKRRPCCWYGCVHRTDKPVSPSVQSLILDKQHKS